MKNFFLKVLSSILSSLILLIIVFVIALSLLSKKFPPDLETAREYTNNLIHAKKNYIALLNQSKKQLEQENLGTDSVLSEKAQSQSNSYMRIYRPDDDQIKNEIKIIKARLDEIEKQNKLILEKLNL